MIKTYGLTHIALVVKDVQRASNFYKQVFGATEMYKSNGFIQVQTPDTHDIIVFEQGNKDPATNGIRHFGFRLVSLKDIDQVVKIVEDAGGKIKDSGEFAPGEPYFFIYDPDGYEVEIWYEKLPDSNLSFN